MFNNLECDFYVESCLNSKRMCGVLIVNAPMSQLRKLESVSSGIIGTLWFQVTKFKLRVSERNLLTFIAKNDIEAALRSGKSC